MLIEFSKTLKQCSPKNATDFRLDCEEFAIIYPCKKLEIAVGLAEEIRSSVENISIKSNNKLVTIIVSAGIAIDKPGEVDITNLLKHSDMHLFLAKSLGRNRVVFQ